MHYNTPSMEEAFNITNTIKEAAITTLLEKAISSVFSHYKKSKDKKNAYKTNPKFIEKTQNHFNELFNWSKELEFIGLGGKPINTMSKTIKLQYKFSKSRYHIDETIENAISENYIMDSEENILIEGDPGSGKSTTLKRLLYNYFFNTDCLFSRFSYPILIRFRNIELDFNLYTYIAFILGITYETRIEKFEIEVTKSKSINQNGTTKEITYKTTEIREKNTYYINGSKIETFIIDLIEKNSVLMIMDGFDETKSELANAINTQIKNMALRLYKSKIILTSRPSYIKENFSNFAVYQVSPLTTKQMNLIANLWLKDYLMFGKELRNKSYYELANRPLFLSFLILLYKDKKNNVTTKLPKFSRDVYEQIIHLLLSKWDQDKGVERVSRYSEFDAGKKLLFLAHLSFRLTYIIKETNFTKENLIQAYNQIYPVFDLPENEAELVAEELEQHTGIISRGLYNKYEFSHLAIQEYLCAVFIIRAPIMNSIKTYLEYPSPLAVAVALSTNSAAWLAELLTKAIQTVSNDNKLTNIVAKILGRILIETPFFEKDINLAVALLTIYKKCNAASADFNESFEKIICLNKGIEVSILELLSNYEKVKMMAYHDKMCFQIKDTLRDSDYPKLLCLPQKFYLI